jgi:hypothetical protein
VFFVLIVWFCRLPASVRCTVLIVFCSGMRSYERWSLYCFVLLVRFIDVFSPMRRPYFTPYKGLLILISIGGWVNPSTIVRLEVLATLKKLDGLIRYRNRVLLFFKLFNGLNFVQRSYSLWSELLSPWPESASELYPSSDSRLSAKLVPTFADRGYHVVSVTDPSGRILGFLD